VLGAEHLCLATLEVSEVVLALQRLPLVPRNPIETYS
jgi:hypothetical protein